LRERRPGSKIFAGTAFHRVPAPLHPWKQLRLKKQICLRSSTRTRIVLAVVVSGQISHLLK